MCSLISKQVFFMSLCRNLQQMGFKGLLHEGNVNAESMDSLFSTACHKLKARTGEKVKEEIVRHLAYLGLPFFLEHTCLVALFLGPFPLQQEITTFICHGSVFSGYLSNAVSAAGCYASIRCHSHWGDWVNGRAFSLEKEGQTGQLLSLPGELCLWNSVPVSVPGSMGCQSFGHRFFSAWPPTLCTAMHFFEERKMHLSFLAFILNPRLVWILESELFFK